MADQPPDADSAGAGNERDTDPGRSVMLKRIWVLLPLVVFGVFANIVQVVSSIHDRQYSILWTSLGVLAALSAVALGADLWRRRARWLRHNGNVIGSLIVGCVALSAISVAALVPALVVLGQNSGSSVAPSPSPYRTTGTSSPSATNPQTVEQMPIVTIDGYVGSDGKRRSKDERAETPSSLQLTGSCQNIPVDLKIWVLGKTDNDNNDYPQYPSVPVDNGCTRGHWTSQEIFLDHEGATDFIYNVVLIDEATAQRWAALKAGRPGMPDSANQRLQPSDIPLPPPSTLDTISLFHPT